WTVDSNPATTILATGAADNTIRLWNLRTGKCLKTWDFPTTVKRVEFSADGPSGHRGGVPDQRRSRGRAGERTDPQDHVSGEQGDRGGVELPEQVHHH